VTLNKEKVDFAERKDLIIKNRNWIVQEGMN
jgi:hypothetical protein